MSELIQNKMLSLMRIGFGVLVLPFCSEEDASNIHPCEEISNIVHKFNFQVSPYHWRMTVSDFTLMPTRLSGGSYCNDRSIVGLHSPKYEIDSENKLKLVREDIRIYTRTNMYGPFCGVMEGGTFHIRCPEITIHNPTPREAYLHHLAHPIRFPKIPQHIIDEWKNDYPIDEILAMLTPITELQVPVDKIAESYEKIFDMLPNRENGTRCYFQTLLAIYLSQTLVPKHIIVTFFKNLIDSCFTFKF